MPTFYIKKNLSDISKKSQPSHLITIFGFIESQDKYLKEAFLKVRLDAPG